MIEKGDVAAVTQKALDLLEASAEARRLGEHEDADAMIRCATKLMAPIRRERVRRGKIHTSNSNRYVAVEEGKIT